MILLPDYDIVTSFLVPIILLQNMTSNVLEYPRILFTSVLYLKVESLARGKKYLSAQSVYFHDINIFRFLLFQIQFTTKLVHE